MTLPIFFFLSVNHDLIPYTLWYFIAFYRLHVTDYMPFDVGKVFVSHDPLFSARSYLLAPKEGTRNYTLLQNV